MLENIQIQIAIRKDLSDNFRLQIKSQNSREISHITNSGYIFKCASNPEISSNRLYLRGEDRSKDYRWLVTSSKQISTVVRGLLELAQENAFQTDINNDNPKEIVFTIYNENRVISTINLVEYHESLINRIHILNASFEGEFSNIKMICETCNKESPTCQIIPNGYESNIICKSCLDNMKSCEFCGSKSSNIKTHINSLGIKKDVCNRCSKTVDCSNCKFKELSHEVRHFADIDTEGNTRNSIVCIKCNKNNLQCRNCGNHYPKSLPKCVCKIPTEFKPFGLQPYNADVTQMLPADSDAEIGMEFEVGVKCSNRIHYERNI